MQVKYSKLALLVGTKKMSLKLCSTFISPLLSAPALNTHTHTDLPQSFCVYLSLFVGYLLVYLCPPSSDTSMLCRSINMGDIVITITPARSQPRGNGRLVADDATCSVFTCVAVVNGSRRSPASESHTHLASNSQIPRVLTQKI